MRPAPVSRVGLVAAVLVAVLVAVVWRTDGGAMFSPGALHAADSTPALRGGVRAHAELSARCDACHAAPWSATRMDARCLQCHDDIQTALADTTTLHGAMRDVRACVTCHGEHAGAESPAFKRVRLGEMHQRLGFPLTGAHRALACEKCHRNASTLTGYARAPKTCIECHRSEDKHKGGFGEDCGSCHGTRRWTGARFEHRVFPLDHGEGGRIACKTCHENPSNYKQYTCYNCHEHSRARVEREHRGEVRAQNLDDCVRCHRGGRKED
ncbi:MAG: cytochrome c3 family protein [Gemmatimonadota bacterium]|nr:cytochrome c3 family protein [Gemmatimonadota bacterium]